MAVHQSIRNRKLNIFLIKNFITALTSKTNSSKRQQNKRDDQVRFICSNRRAIDLGQVFTGSIRVQISIRSQYLQNSRYDFISNKPSQSRRQSHTTLSVDFRHLLLTWPSGWLLSANKITKFIYILCIAFLFEPTTNISRRKVSHRGLPISVRCS